MSKLFDSAVLALSVAGVGLFAHPTSAAPVGSAHLPHGAPAPVVDRAAPAPSALDTQALRLDHGTVWQAMVDPATGITQVASGPALQLLTHPAPTVFELDAAARAFLDRHLVAFGAASRDLDLLAANPVGSRHTVMVYQQRLGDLDVLGAQVSLLFQGPALEVVSAHSVTAQPLAAFVLDETEATEAAHTALDDLPVADHRDIKRATKVWFPTTAGLRPAWQFLVTTRAPMGAYDLVIDGETGDLLRRASLLPHAVAQVVGEAAPDQPLGPRTATSIPFWSTGATADGRADVAMGPLSIPFSGARVEVTDDLAAVGSEATVSPASADLFEVTSAPPEQIDGWVWGHRAVDYGRAMAPNLAWVQDTLGVHVNFANGANPYCNAFYAPEAAFEPTSGDVHFFREGSFTANDGTYLDCINTATVGQVVLHEWGHGFHDHLLPSGLGANGYNEVEFSISEGVGDYIAATILDNPTLEVDAIFTMASQFRGGRRFAENTLQYPSDLIPGDVHSNGQIWSGTFWDLRKQLIAKYGYAVGVRTADELHTKVLAGSPNWTNAHQLAVSLDDDDGNPANGSPNSCEINAAFAAHGLANAVAPGAGSLRFTHDPAAVAAGGDVSAQISSAPSCGALDPATVELRYQLGDEPEQSLAMTQSGDSFNATVPDARGRVVRYRIVASSQDGTEQAWPPAGNQFGVAVGATSASVTWDFEDGGAGWTHGAERPEQDEWQFGPPEGKAGDPTGAVSGNSVAGTDIGGIGNGAYDEDATTYLESPALGCGSCSGARLRFYRSLSLGRGDTARVVVGGQVVWEGTGPIDDPGFTAQEISLDGLSLTDDARVRFEIESDGGDNRGGWTLDDVALLGPGGGGGGDGDFNNTGDVLGGCGCRSGGSGASGLTQLFGLLMIGWFYAQRPARRGRQSGSASLAG